MDTLPKLLQGNMQTFGSQVGMREKDRGIWQSYSWRQCYDHVREFALGLAAAGFKRGDKLSVLGDNRPRLYWAQLAAQALGGMAVPLYQDSIASELAFVLQHAEVVMSVAEDQEQIDKILSIAGELPSLRLLVYEDSRGMSAYDHPLLKSFTDLEAMGRAFDAIQPRYFERELNEGPGSDVALISYATGTTGRSKGALLSHVNMIATSESFASVESIERGDNWLCYLPMGWVGDSMFSLSTSLVVAATCNCPESPETVQRDLRELGPSALLGPPRIWESMLTGLQVRAADASWLKRHVYEYFRRIAQRRELLKDDSKPIPFSLALAYRVGEALVFGPLPGTDVRIGELGEVQVRGPGVFVGYYKQEDATRDAITPDGWLKTGDAGLVDPRGQLAIIDRVRDVGKLADSTPFAPQFIENKLKFSPYVREAVAFGDRRSFVTAMIAIDISTVGKWAEQRSLPYTSYMDLARKPEVASLVIEEVAKINATLPEPTKIRRVVLLNKELEADDAEMTRTRKVRRAFVAEKYAPVIEALYSGAGVTQLTMNITFEDGRRSSLTTTLAVHDVLSCDAAGRVAA